MCFVLFFFFLYDECAFPLFPLVNTTRVCGRPPSLRDQWRRLVCLLSRPQHRPNNLIVVMEHSDESHRLGVLLSPWYQINTRWSNNSLRSRGFNNRAPNFPVFSIADEEQVSPNTTSVVGELLSIMSARQPFLVTLNLSNMALASWLRLDGCIWVPDKFKMKG